MKLFGLTLGRGLCEERKLLLAFILKCHVFCFIMYCFLLSIIFTSLFGLKEHSGLFENHIENVVHC